jgi:hypothetical protein
MVLLIFRVNSLSVWAWSFLLGHLIWATGFMFLISWRGYWQELIESIVWAHEQTPIATGGFGMKSQLHYQSYKLGLVALKRLGWS